MKGKTPTPKSSRSSASNPETASSATASSSAARPPPTTSSSASRPPPTSSSSAARHPPTSSSAARPTPALSSSASHPPTSSSAARHTHTSSSTDVPSAASDMSATTSESSVCPAGAKKAHERRLAILMVVGGEGDSTTTHEMAEAAACSQPDVKRFVENGYGPAGSSVGPSQPGSTARNPRHVLNGVRLATPDECLPAVQTSLISASYREYDSVTSVLCFGRPIDFEEPCAHRAKIGYKAGSFYLCIELLHQSSYDAYEVMGMLHRVCINLKNVCKVGSCISHDPLGTIVLMAPRDDDTVLRDISQDNKTFSKDGAAVPSEALLQLAYKHIKGLQVVRRSACTKMFAITPDELRSEEYGEWESQGLMMWRERHAVTTSVSSISVVTENRNEKNLTSAQIGQASVLAFKKLTKYVAKVLERETFTDK